MTGPAAPSSDWTSVQRSVHGRRGKGSFPTAEDAPLEPSFQPQVLVSPVSCFVISLCSIFSILSAAWCFLLLLSPPGLSITCLPSFSHLHLLLFSHLVPYSPILGPSSQQPTPPTASQPPRPGLALAVPASPACLPPLLCPSLLLSVQGESQRGML